MSYTELMAFQRQTEALSQISGRLGWDQETVMPRGAAEQRSEELAALEEVLHARRSDPRIGAWLAGLSDDLDPVARAQVRQIRRSHSRATRVPARLASEIARVTSVAQGEWAAARAADDFPAFTARLAEVVALKREEGAALAQGGDAYDAMLDDYEPGMTAADLERMFGALRPRLVALRDRILGSDRRMPKLAGSFPEPRQLAISRDLAMAFGYDFERGRIDRAVHPFSSGSGADVRITTRTDPKDPFNCFYSTIHEVGHAVYEQHIEPGYALTPLGSGVSMGVHESQSRLFENQLGRSRAFTGWLYERMETEFGTLSVADADAFYATVNRVEPGFIRTEADEVHYNLHIMLRFDLERDLIAGRLEAADLEEAWNTRFAQDFGQAVPRASLGCLQDVHWPVGLFGYFPTYALGNVYAGVLYRAMRAALPDLDAKLAQADTAQALDWLARQLQRHGGLHLPAETVTRAAGEKPSEAPLIDYLEAKFTELYAL